MTSYNDLIIPLYTSKSGTSTKYLRRKDILYFVSISEKGYKKKQDIPRFNDIVTQMATVQFFNYYS